MARRVVRLMFFAPHHDVHDRVLVGPRLDALTETSRASLDASLPELRAFWVDPEGAPILLAATPEGPTLVVAGERHLLGTFEVVIAPIDPHRRICTITNDGAVIATVEYELPPSSGGWWEEDGRDDFFGWLAGNASDPAFRRYWTAALPTC